MSGLTVTELHTQDGWDWPNGQHDEQCWPASLQVRFCAAADNVLRRMRHDDGLLRIFNREFAAKYDAARRNNA